MTRSRTRVSILFCVGLLLAVALLEVGFRIIEWTPAWRVLPVIQRQFGRPDPHTGYSLRPNVQGIWVREHRAHVSINAHGLRDRPVTHDKPVDTIRIALVGDSVTESLQVDGSLTFDTLAENILSQKLHRSVDILNLGMSGANPLIQLLRLKHVGMPLSPDLAIFVIKLDDFVHSPLSDDTVLPGYVRKANGSYELGQRYLQRRSIRLRDELPGRVFFWLMDNSRTAALLYNRHQLGFWAAWPKTRALTKSVSDPCHALEELLRPMYALWHDHQTPETFDLMQNYFDDLSDTRTRNRLPVVFLAKGFGKPRPECHKAMQIRAQTVAAAKRLLAAEGIEMIDRQSELLDRYSREEISHFWGFGAKVGDGHLNPAGHRAYAEMIVDIVHGYFSTQRNTGDSDT